MKNPTAGAKSGWLPALTAGLVGLSVFVWLASPAFVAGETSWYVDSARDPVQQVTGLRYFLAAPWTFPVLNVPALDFPGGTIIAFTDSLPLGAIIAKVFGAAPATAPMILGLWLAVCVFLQPVAFVWLLRNLGVRRTLFQWVGALFSLVSAPFLGRFGHAALFGHFLITGALALDFEARKARVPERFVYGFLFPITLALLIHPYLMAMVFAVFGIALLQLLWEGRLKATRALVAALVAVSLVGGISYVLGTIGHSPLVPKAYGDYAFNLASPFMSRSSALLPLGAFDVWNHESLLYLGLGGLLILATSLFVCRKRIPSEAVVLMPTISICAALLLFAATYAIRFGPFLVAGISETKVRELFLARRPGGIAGRLGLLQWVDWIRIALLPCLAMVPVAVPVFWAVRTKRSEFLKFSVIACLAAAAAFAAFPYKLAVILSNFQSSARFMWIPYYLVMAAAIAAVSRITPTRAALALLSGALVIQVVDLAPLWCEFKALSVVHSQVRFSSLAEPFSKATSIFLIPDYECALQLTDRSRWEEIGSVYDNLHGMASLRTTPINSMRHARMSALLPSRSKTACKEEISQSVKLDGPDGRVWVFVDLGLAGLLTGSPQVEAGECMPAEVGWWCTKRRPTER